MLVSANCHRLPWPFQPHHGIGPIGKVCMSRQSYGRETMNMIFDKSGQRHQIISKRTTSRQQSSKSGPQESHTGINGKEKKKVGVGCWCCV